MRSLSVFLTACSAAALLAACGGEQKQRSEPRIARSAAQELASESEEIARRLDAGDVCGAAHGADGLRAHAQAAVDDGQVPSALAPELLASADTLVGEVNCPPPPPPPREHGKSGKPKKEDKKHKRKRDR